MIELLEFILAILLAPIFFFAILVTGIVNFLRTMFDIPLLCAAVGLLGFTAVTWPHMTPDPKVPFNTIVDIVAQAHIFGLPVPCITAGLGVATIAASIGFGLRGRLGARGA